MPVHGGDKQGIAAGLLEDRIDYGPGDPLAAEVGQQCLHVVASEPGQRNARRGVVAQQTGQRAAERRVHVRGHVAVVDDE